jgi:hypothetical protein
MSIRSKRLRVPALLLTVLTALLVLATAASAETRTGESSTVEFINSPTPEGTLVKASASYESTGGSLSFSATTAAEPHAEKEGIPSVTEVEALFFTGTSECSLAALQAEAITPPVAILKAPYAKPTAEAVLINNPAELPSAEFLPATKTVSEKTTTVSFTSAAFAGKGFDCAVVGTGGFGGQTYTVFPITAPPAPPAPPVVPSSPSAQAPPAPQAAPAPAPAALSIAKPKALKLKVGKSRTVKVKVTNTGATATVQGTLRMKAVKGVIVKPETQKLPVLAPGASWSVSIRVELTEKAKEKSTLSLIGTASGLTAKSSLVVKLQG